MTVVVVVVVVVVVCERQWGRGRTFVGGRLNCCLMM